MFDMGVLNALISEYGISKPLCNYIDTVEIARRMWPFLPNHRLNTVCEYLGIELNHHEALSDARGSALILMNAMVEVNDFNINSFINHLKLKEKSL
jgi:DNA polymerase-3 subunit epsilon